MAVPVLMYHEVAAASDVDALARKTQRGYIVTRDDFERQMVFIAQAGFQPVTLDALYEWSQAARPLPANPVVITFDDGFAGNFAHAFPILRKFGFSATFFVVTNRVGDAAMLTWSQLAEMRAHGMAIESHTMNHPLLSTLTEARTREELGGSKRALEDRLGAGVKFLSLPNGDSNAFYPAVAAAAGYLGGCGSEFGFNDRSTDRFFWRRIAVKQNLPLARFADLLLRRRSTMLYHAAKAAAKAAVARSLGKKNYDRIYNAVFGVDEQDKSKS